VNRRSLSQTLLELLDTLAPTDVAAAGLRVARVDLDLPLEVRLAGTTDRPELLADVPRWRWRTVFDDVPSRAVVKVVRGWTS